MKKILFLACLGTTTLAAKAQLTTQRWQATISIPSPTDCYLQFDHDTLKLFMKDAPDEPLELMRFTTSNDTLTLNKISGQSPCGGQQVTYKTAITDNQLQFTKVSDDCDARVSAFIEQPWKPYTGAGN